MTKIATDVTIYGLIFPLSYVMEFVSVSRDQYLLSFGTARLSMENIYVMYFHNKVEFTSAHTILYSWGSHV